jgi:hypothetical protein
LNIWRKKAYLNATREDCSDLSRRSKLGAFAVYVILAVVKAVSFRVTKKLKGDWKLNLISIGKYLKI